MLSKVLANVTVVLHQKSSSPLLEFFVCSHSQTTESNPVELQTFPHMLMWAFPKCYISWKREKVKVQVYFYETNNYINYILTLSLDHKLRINFTFILSIFLNSFVLMWSMLSFVFIEGECKKIIIFQFSTLNCEKKKEKIKRDKNLLKIIFQITISLIFRSLHNFDYYK